MCTGKKAATVHAEGQFPPVKYHENHVYMELPVLQLSYTCFSIYRSPWTPRRISENLDWVSAKGLMYNWGGKRDSTYTSKYEPQFLKTAFEEAHLTSWGQWPRPNTIRVTRSTALPMASAFHPFSSSEKRTLPLLSGDVSPLSLHLSRNLDFYDRSVFCQTMVLLNDYTEPPYFWERCGVVLGYVRVKWQRNCG